MKTENSLMRKENKQKITERKGKRSSPTQRKKTTE